MPDEILPQNGLGLDIEMSIEHDNDPRNFQLEQVMGSFFGGYKPKNVRKIIPMGEVKDQRDVNSCVTQAVAGQKEVQEGVPLSPGFLGANLVKKGQMNAGGTSIRAAIQATVDDGISEESVTPTKNTTFAEFSHPSQLTPAAFENAASHKSKSYWQTSDLDTILQTIDQYDDRVGVTGQYWFPEYNGAKTQPLRYLGSKANLAHCTVIRGYDMEYMGKPCLVFRNSFGKNWGSSGDFYVTFDEFNKIIQFSTYFVLDIEKDVASFLSLYGHRAIRDVHGAHRNGGEPVYIIEGNKKRWVPNEALLNLLGILAEDGDKPYQQKVDHENILAVVEEGPQMTLDDIPPIELEKKKRDLELLNDPRTLKQIQDIYPGLFK